MAACGVPNRVTTCLLAPPETLSSSSPRGSSGSPSFERSVNRKEVYGADEVFMSGAAAEVTPERAVDGRLVGRGRVGLVTEAIGELCLDVAHDNKASYLRWCLPGYASAVPAVLQ